MTSDPCADTLPPGAETHIPGPGRLPSEFADTQRPDPLRAIAERVGDLSDALHDPEGLVHRLFAQVESRAEASAAARHRQVMETLGTLANQVTRLTAIVAKLVPEQERQAAQLKLVKTSPKRKRARANAAE